MVSNVAASASQADKAVFDFYKARREPPGFFCAAAFPGPRDSAAMFALGSSSAGLNYIFWVVSLFGLERCNFTWGSGFKV